jgi:tRNA(Ile)-lysidine synthase
MNRLSDEAFARELSRLRVQPGTALVAVSGGVDSLVLLDLLVRTRDRHGLTLIVAHVDHGIQSESAAVAAAVEGHAAALGLPSVTARLALGPGTSETRARAARMTWLERTRLAHHARYLLLAHHADDQAETVLMRLLRGSGPAGLAGMPARRGPLLRPLLGVTRKALVDYAESHEIEWWSDPANVDSRHLRSWIRCLLLPELEGRLPDVRTRLGQASRHAASQRRAWSQMLRHWPGLDYRKESGVHSLALPVIAALPPALRLGLLEALARRAGAVPGLTRLRRAWRSLVTAQSGATADLGGGWRLEMAWDRLRLLPANRVEVRQSKPIESERGTMTWGEFRLDWLTEPAPSTQLRDGTSAWFVPGTLMVRPWRAGDRVAPLHGTGHRLAVRCFQDARVASSDRARWPILEGGGQLAWIPAVCRGDVLVPKAGEPALRVDVTRHG